MRAVALSSVGRRRHARGLKELVSCSAVSLDSSRRALATERPPCFVARPHRSTSYGCGLAPRLMADFARSFIVGIYGTGHHGGGLLPRRLRPWPNLPVLEAGAQHLRGTRRLLP